MCKENDRHARGATAEGGVFLQSVRRKSVRRRYCGFNLSMKNQKISLYGIKIESKPSFGGLNEPPSGDSKPSFGGLNEVKLS